MAKREITTYSAEYDFKEKSALFRTDSQQILRGNTGMH